MGKSLLTLTVLLLAMVTTSLYAEDWRTYYEKSNYLETPRYAETIEFCERLDDYSPMLQYSSFGVSPQGRDLPLLILDKDSEFDPNGEKTSRKAILLFQAGIHSGEIEGKDAGLMFLRDIAVDGKYIDLLDSVVILFIPIFSVDAHERFGPYNRPNQNGPKEMGWRTTAQNLNLNRDFLKADAPEMVLWLELFNRWLPDFLVDIHTSDGADYQYVITYALEYNTDVAEPLATWSHDEFLPEITGRMDEAGYPFVPYIVTRYDHDVTRGLMHWTATPRYSNGYGAAQNRPFLLIETHMLKDYETRVASVYELMVQLTRYFNERAGELRHIVRASDSTTAEDMAGSYFPLRYRLTDDTTSVDFLGVKFSYRISPISGDSIVVWSSEKADYRVPLFCNSVATDSALMPFAYLIPQEWQHEISILQLQGVAVRYLTEPIDLEVTSYRLSNPKWAKGPFESRFMVRADVEPYTEVRSYPAGTAVALMNQRANRVIAHLLEPKGPDSFLSWGFFNAIFERKEYIEDYVIEPIAAGMLASDSALAAEFQQKLDSDSTFAADPEARLDFFYQRTPYFDQMLGVYPIGKLMEKRELPVQ
jgi:hypothetical protein